MSYELTQSDFVFRQISWSNSVAWRSYWEYTRSICPPTGNYYRQSCIVTGQIWCASILFILIWYGLSCKLTLSGNSRSTHEWSDCWQHLDAFVSLGIGSFRVYAIVHQEAGIYVALSILKLPNQSHNSIGQGSVSIISFLWFETWCCLIR